MKTLKFQIQINAAAEKVWKCLWEKESYKIWTNPFCEGSYYKTDNFYEGNRIHFLTPNGDGMYSIIEKIIENKYLAFKHLGDIKNFEEIPIEQNKSWTNAMETYELIKNGNGVQLIVHADALDEYFYFMNKTFPLALEELKRISEK